MTNNYQFYSQLANWQTTQVTGSMGNWTGFLETAGRLYKYPFEEQLMIHAQRPDAVACAPFEIWNESMHRYVKRGSKGIALLDNTQGTPRLKYVFDVSDTGNGRQNARRPFIWEFKPEHETVLLEALKGFNDASEFIDDEINNEHAFQGNFIGDYIYTLAQTLSARFYLDNKRDIELSTEGSLLEGSDEQHISSTFQEALTVSTAYSIMTRCGIDPGEYISEEDFQPVFDFNNSKSVCALGEAVSSLSEGVLREIEVTIKKYEREKNAERGNGHGRDNIHADRGLFDARHSDSRNDKIVGQVRDDAEKPFEQTSEDSVRELHSGGDVVLPLFGDRGNSDNAVRVDDGRVDNAESATGQSQRPDGLGGTHEQPESPSGGSYISGVDLQLNDEVEGAAEIAASVSFLPTDDVIISPAPIFISNDNDIRKIDLSAYHDGDVIGYNAQGVRFNIGRSGDFTYTTSTTFITPMGDILGVDDIPTDILQQIYTARGMEAVQSKNAAPPEQELSELDNSFLSEELASSAISLESIDSILRAGGNSKDSILHIASYFSKGKTPEENAEFLQREYKSGGKGFQFGNQQISAWFNESGITLGVGKSAVQSRDSVHLSWEQVETRIRELFYAGLYVSRDTFKQAVENEHAELAERLLFFYRDSLRDFREMPEEWRAGKGGFPDDKENVKKLLLDKDGHSDYSLILKRLEDDIAALQTDENAPTRLWHSPSRLLEDVRDCGIEPRSFPTREIPIHNFMPFITEDEVTKYLTRGSNISQSKMRIFSFFLHEHTDKEKADFLKKEYGWGGRTHALSGADNSYADASPSGGIHIKRGSLSDPYDEVKLSWSAAAKRVNNLINEGRYMSQAGLDLILAYEKEMLAREILFFYDGLPLEIERPFEISGFFVDRENIQSVSELLDNLDIVDKILESMSPILKNTPDDDRYYKNRHNAFRDLTAFRDGTYTLFPQLSAIAPPADTIMPLPASPSTALVGKPAIKKPATDFQPIKQEPVEQLSLYPLPSRPSLPNEETQRRNIEKVIEAEVLAAPVVSVSIEQSDIDAAIIAWNGDIDSKIRVFEYMGENARARETANYLKTEYGGNLDALIVTKDGIEPVSLQWPKIQRRIAQLVNEERFLTVDERTISEETEVTAVKTAETLAVESFVDIDNFLPQPNKEQETVQTSAGANFRITDDYLGEGGPKTKYSYNVAAIRTLQSIESDSRNATPEEQEILSRYVGWGGLPQAFDGEHTGWAKEYAELKELLSPDEYTSAMASTLNAHYTSPIVIKAMYEALERMGVKDGNILEPSCGVGNFFGLIPDGMKNAKLYGVELDSITGRIAKQLYPQADIKVTGFEKTNMPDAFFDVAIGNVPFGSYEVVDRKYNKNNFHIHDYFFAKALEQVRPGGIVAFVTSKFTMDKANPEVRKYIAQRAELLGAVRLPNNAFHKNAGTEVTTDIIFLQKRDRQIDIQPDWVHLGQIEEGIPINSYFVDNPQMILGKMAPDERMNNKYGSTNNTTCLPIEGADLAEQLKTALSSIQGQITEIELDDIEGIQDISIPADPSVRNFSYTIVDNTVYYRENSRMYPVDMPSATLERVRGMVEIRDCVCELINMQLDEYPASMIQEQQAKLNAAYDGFARKHGLINDRANSKAFQADSAYYLLCSLEILDEDSKLERKSDMFTKRTIKQNKIIAAVDTSTEALAVSIGQKARVDLDYMQELTGFTREKVIEDLRGVIFLNIGNASNPNKTYVTADEYLSGNVREKLAQAEAAQAAIGDGSLDINVEALKAAQPKDLEAGEISVRLGSTWVDKRYIQQFMYELLQTPFYLKNTIQVDYSEHTGVWNVSGKARVSFNDVFATVTYGTSRMNAYQIIEETLNLKDARVYDTKIENGKETRVLNKKETTLAAQKQDAIKQAFKDWVFNDPVRRQDLVALYNARFNSTRPRVYDGSHIQFGGISPEITLKPHQTAAIARILYGGNTLLAHEVGAGKTFEMVGAAMELKRLGLCNKSLMAVPNHLTEQIAGEFLRLYPSANILVATKKDFETKNRKKFCAKIATGDYDAIIIGHSQLEKIPLSKERQERLLQDQIFEITIGIDSMSGRDGSRFSIKQMEKTKKNLEARLEKLNDDSRKDDVVTFEQLGVDRLFIDESHNFKNLFMYTKMRNVAGLSQSEAQKSSDLFMKCRYMDELTDNKGNIHATGTPISNSMTEMYTTQRYLQYDTLQRKGMVHFDAWASTFGETATSIELAPEGSGYRARTRFAKFQNLPELMNMFGEVADIKTADTLDLPRPKANFHTIVVKPTEIQKEMVQDLSERAKAVHNKEVEPHEDNMLVITSDGRKIGLDQRLMNDMLPDDPGSKVNVCMDNIYRIWDETADSKLTQLLFCDFSTPNKDGRFNVYDDIKNKLIAKGIPESEIAFIHDANTEVQKKELFAKVRAGKIRVLMGSTFKCGAGTNVQDRLVALHDLDAPWRPSDLKQREGRINRQGNMNPEVDIFRYVTEGTFDAYLFQTIEKKQEFISQIMTSKSPMRSCDDVDEEALSYAEIKALCAGNPYIKEKMQLDIDVAKLKLLKSEHQNQQYRLQDNLLQYFPMQIESTKEHIEGFKADIARLETNTHKSEESISPMVIGNKTYTDRGEAGAALLEACKSIISTQPVKIGSYRGFDMLISFDSYNKVFHCNMKGSMTHSTALGNDSFGNITRINNAFEKLPQRLRSSEAMLLTLNEQVENAKTELAKPFSFEAELTEKSSRLVELDSLLSIDGSPETEQESEHENDDCDEQEYEDDGVAAKKAPSQQLEPVKKSAKGPPSLIATLEKNAEKSRLMFGGAVEKDKKPEVVI